MGAVPTLRTITNTMLARWCSLALLCVAIVTCETSSDFDMADKDDVYTTSVMEFTQTMDLAGKAKVHIPAKVKEKLMKKVKKAVKKKAAKKKTAKHFTSKGLFVPKFVGAKVWAHENELHHKQYERINKYYMKINKKKFLASNRLEAKLNKKAGEAQQKLYKAKEMMQKKYAHDDPVDYGPPGMPKAVERAHKRRTQGDGRNESGSYGASGCNPEAPGCTQKWYPDGAISSNAYTDKKGRYFLGTNRRRVGAGFGRRRAEKWVGKVSGHLQRKITKGHDLLKAATSSRVLRHGKKTTLEKRAHSKLLAAAKTHAKKKATHKKKKAKKLPKGVVEANKKL